MVSPDQLSQLHFLVVEDNAFTAMELCESLKTLGASRIETAQEGREALKKLDSMDPEPQVLMIDLRMPGMGGTELLDRLAERKYRGHIIISSGVDGETMEAVKALAQSGGLSVRACIGKPLDQQALAQAMERVIG